MTCLVTISVSVTRDLSFLWLRCVYVLRVSQRAILDEYLALRNILKMPSDTQTGVGRAYGPALVRCAVRGVDAGRNASRVWLHVELSGRQVCSPAGPPGAHAPTAAPPPTRGRPRRAQRHAVKHAGPCARAPGHPVVASTCVSLCFRLPSVSAVPGDGRLPLQRRRPLGLRGGGGGGRSVCGAAAAEAARFAG